MPPAPIYLLGYRLSQSEGLYEHEVVTRTLAKAVIHSTDIAFTCAMTFHVLRGYSLTCKSHTGWHFCTPPSALVRALRREGSVHWLQMLQSRPEQVALPLPYNAQGLRFSHLNILEAKVLFDHPPQRSEVMVMSPAEKFVYLEFTWLSLWRIKGLLPKR